MSGKQFPFLGLILAILLGPRVVNRSDTPGPARRGSNKVEKTHSPKETTNTTHAAKDVPAVSNGRCARQRPEATLVAGGEWPRMRALGVAGVARDLQNQARTSER
jgi:hypothetical protein